MNITFDDVLKIIPLDQPVRTHLLNNMSTFDSAYKFEIQRICWNAFHDLREEMIKSRFEQMMDEVRRGKRTLTPDIMQQVRQVVWQDFENILSGKKQELDEVEQIRSRLQSLMQSQKTA